ncbi:DDE-type integrase/transposase/recombinase [Gordonia amicalis]|uniref:DDE-type integrase/transposase/recombinase n=1 Tax=Gordonia amicalis TaxID=89053 RepID=UPI0015F68DA5|nr:DDE-type integrase/transposase/recombinase [Gordonia amicalis]MBA5846874.1 transposase family protein [Gordonia amicalis]
MLPSPTIYELGDTFTLDDQRYQVIGVGPDRLCARNSDSAAVVFFGSLDLLPEMSPGPLPVGFNPLDSVSSLLSVPEDQRPLVTFWQGHLDELESGVHPDHPNRLSPDYTRDRSRHERIRAKAEELSSIQWPDARHRQVSPRTIERKLRARRDRGPAGLVSGHCRLAKPGGTQDPEFLGVLDDTLSGYEKLSDVPITVMAGRIRTAFRAKHPEYEYVDASAGNYYQFPSYATMYRLIHRRGQHLLVDKPAKRRRSAAATPITPYRPTLTTRPGAEVQADTTTLNIWCLDEAGRAVRPRLSTMIDKHTRMLTSWIITLEDPTAQDLAIMLAESLVPYPLIEGTTERYRLVNSRIPVKKMIALDKRCAAAQARPLIPPERLVLDNGSAYKSSVFDDITAAFGISVTYCNPGSPWEKGIQERLFGTVKSSFTPYFWSYLGVSVEHRGEISATQLSAGADVVRELFSEWALLIYHNQPHDSLCDPMTPNRKLSPLQAYTASLAYAPRFAVPITDRMLYRAYPVKWQKIPGQGIQIDGHEYDSAAEEFVALRNRPSGVLAHGDRWEIRYNPQNRACVWVHNPNTDEWLTVSCVRYRESELPCADQRWQTDLCDDPDLYAHSEDLHARSAAGSRLLSRKRSVRRDRKRLHDNTHLPMPATEPTLADDTTDDVSEDFDSEPAATSYGASNLSHWTV